MKHFFNRRHLRTLLLLALHRVTPVRALTELSLEVFVSDLEITGPFLVAGGTPKSGSEHVILSPLQSSSSNTIFVNINPKSLPTVLADLSLPWPFRDGTFDICVSTWVLEHLKDPWVFFRESYRTLKDEGILIVAVPFIHRVHGSPFDFWRLTDAALVMLCEQAGFREVKTKAIGGGPFLATVALLWPLIKIPLLSGLLLLFSCVFDSILFHLIRIFRKGVPLIGSYPVAYLVFARKGVNCVARK